MDDELLIPPINHTTTKNAQIELLPLIEKYDLPIWFVVVIVSLVALKHLGLIGIVKDIWSWIKELFTQKNVQITHLTEKLNQVENELEILQEKYQNMALKYNSVIMIIRGFRPHLKSLGMDLDEFDKIFNP